MLYLDTFTEADYRRLDEVRAEHCVSIHMPTHRVSRARESDRDKILLRNLVREVGERLGKAGAGHARIAAVEEQLQHLVEDGEFWNYLADGLSIFVSQDRMETYRVPLPLRQEVEISDRFHLKPLLALLTFQHSAFVLDLAQHQVRLWEVTEGDIEQVDVPGMPGDIGEAMSERGLNVDDIMNMQQSAEKKMRQRQFCRAIEQAMRPVLRGRKTPLILAGVDTLLNYYRECDTYGHTLDETISGNQEHRQTGELAQEARSIVARGFAKQVAQMLARVESLRNDAMSSTDISEIARAAGEGRVESTLVNLDHSVYGSFAAGVGRVRPGARESASTYDVLDELAGLVIRQGGQVIGAHGDMLPSGIDAAAIFRFKI